MSVDDYEYIHIPCIYIHEYIHIYMYVGLYTRIHSNMLFLRIEILIT